MSNKAKEKCLYLFKFFELPTPNRFLFARHLWAYLNKTANLLKISQCSLMAHLGLENHDLQRILVAYQNMMRLSVAKISLQTLISTKHEISHPAPKFALPNLKAFENKFLSFLNLDSAKINEKEFAFDFLSLVWS